MHIKYVIKLKRKKKLPYILATATSHSTAQILIPFLSKCTF
jgi:hypothetical protein